jgi:hypothetical protein
LVAAKRCASTKRDELALAIPANAATTDQSNGSVEGLRSMAAWESAEHWHNGRELGKRELAIPTMGASLLFVRPTITEKALVKKFHKDVLK